MTIEEIKATLSKGERLTLECKTSANELPKSLWETYSAFGNTLGGIILLGVQEHFDETDPEKRFTFNGVNNPQKLISDFWNTINSNKVSSNILLDYHTAIHEIDGVSIISIEVPQAPWQQKPIYINDNRYKGAFKRNYSGDYHCTEAEVNSMIRDSFAGGNDEILLEHYGMDDIDPQTLQNYRYGFKLFNRGHVWANIEDDKVFLKNLGALAIDRNTGKEYLTVAGLMMFGKSLSIEEKFSNFRMDYLDMSNLLPEQRYRDRLTYDGRWESNFYNFFQIVLPKFTFDLPLPFKMEDGVQRVDDTAQIAAVREALVNSIIHCDLMQESGVLRIEKHDTYLCLRNPGLPKIPLQQVYEGGISVARNPKIQKMFRMLGYGENIGSGIQKILHAWKEVGWGEPQLIVKPELNETELRLPLPENTNPNEGTDPRNIPESTQEVHKKYTRSTQESTQKSTQKTSTESTQKTSTKSTQKTSTKNKTNLTRMSILEFVRKNPTASMNEISAAITTLSKYGVRYHINALQTKGILIYVGSKKRGHWEIIDK